MTSLIKNGGEKRSGLRETSHKAYTTRFGTRDGPRLPLFPEVAAVTHALSQKAPRERTMFGWRSVSSIWHSFSKLRS